MAERPVFLPLEGSRELVRELHFSLAWNPGLAPAQKKKNILALHEAAARAGHSPLLEVSSKSEEKLGQHLSAFHLKVREQSLAEITPISNSIPASRSIAKPVRAPCSCL